MGWSGQPSSKDEAYEAEPDGVVSAEVHDALGEDLDAYLDRELLRQPAPEPKPTPRAAPPPPKPRKSLQGMLALAAEEERWLCTKPGPDGRPEPPQKGGASSKGVKPQEVSATQTTQVLLPDLAWGDEPAPLSEEERSSLQKPWKSLEETLRPQGPRRRPIGKWVGMGAGALGVLAAGVMWARSSGPRQAEVAAAYVPAGTVAAVVPGPAAREKPSARNVPPAPPAPPVARAVAPVAVAPVAVAPVAVVPVAKAVPPPPAPEPSKLDSAEALDAEFAKKLSVADKRSAQAPARRAAPGWGPSASRDEEEDEDADSAGANADLPERLDPGEIQSVVVANQPAIASCIRRHKEAPGNEGGSFVLRWTILASGSTAQVGMATEEMRGTPLARCIEGLVRGWKFPRHRVQQAPIQFPFRF
ncbi:adventurous gliding motility protein X-like protein [Stigmatella aurantiaca DW4/3-1]|uniref:Adventurous gliding motility protein X, putative n=2 Tax=Stigmatella aurantiaca TaxID=41 RepID=Q090T3_STIAD|nr:adventurous gliding motility protein X-like protein [Stigmatella aurantiaca DW4/3-1]EAU66263.1 adventurous gliding motility protein X, putative [Stigmatella aurantiaca DW4/3-1]